VLRCRESWVIHSDPAYLPSGAGQGGWILRFGSSKIAHNFSYLPKGSPKPSLFSTFCLRVSVTRLRTPSTGGAEMRRRGARRGGRERRRWVRFGRWIKIRGIRAGRAKKLGRISVSFVSTLFENLISEEICGRFGSFDGSTSVYRALRLRPMIECQLHCLDGFRLLCSLKHNKQRMACIFQ